MKKLFRVFPMLLALAAVISTAACSDDDLGNSKAGTEQNEDDETTPSVYVGVNFTMPSVGQGRSYTDGDDSSNDGTEVGTDAENNVGEVLLVLADKSYRFIASATVPKKDIYKHSGSSESTGTAGAYHANARFTKTQLSTYYMKPGTQDYVELDDPEILVFVIVNPSGNLVKTIAEADFGDIDWVQTKGEVKATGIQTDGSIWTANSFLMSNASIAIREIPSKFTDWNEYATSSHYFHLSESNGTGHPDNSAQENGKGGPISVIRAAARMDFKDGSTTGIPNTYNVIFEDNENGKPDLEKPIINITLNKMCLVNMNNSFYYLKRVSANGLDTGAPAQGATQYDPETATNGWQLCGPEKPWWADANGTPVGSNGNYVVDSWADMKNTFIDQFGDIVDNKYPFEYTKYFNYSFFDNAGDIDDNTTQGSTDGVGRWYVSQISDVLNGDKDNWKNKEYHVWRYLTENTIPAPSSKQVNGISTGVVFKGKLVVDDKAIDKPLENLKDSAEYYTNKAYNDLISLVRDENKTLGNTDKDPILYSVGGDIYASWENLRMAAIYSSITYTLSPDGTQFIVDWNRENSLYQAVFGNGGTGFTMEYKVKEGTNIGEEGKEDSYVVTATYRDPLDIDENAPDALWTIWNNADRPSSTDKTKGDLIINFKKAATGNDITLYQTSQDNVDGWGYYCYYYYWNRHNDNGNDGVMGPMEFAVVRNNVYKLSVTEISRLGHPRIPLNDPDSPTPKTPNEKENVYLTVDAKVLPWVVRVNNIKF